MRYSTDDIHSVVFDHDGLVVRLKDGTAIEAPRARLDSLLIERTSPPLREPRYCNEPLEYRITGKPSTITLRMTVDGGADHDG